MKHVLRTREDGDITMTTPEAKALLGEVVYISGTESTSKMQVLRPMSHDGGTFALGRLKAMRGETKHGEASQSGNPR